MQSKKCWEDGDNHQTQPLTTFQIENALLALYYCLGAQLVPIVLDAPHSLESISTEFLTDWAIMCHRLGLCLSKVQPVSLLNFIRFCLAHSYNQPRCLQMCSFPQGWHSHSWWQCTLLAPGQNPAVVHLKPDSTHIKLLITTFWAQRWSQFSSRLLGLPYWLQYFNMKLRMLWWKPSYRWSRLHLLFSHHLQMQ